MNLVAIERWLDVKWDAIRALVEQSETEGFHFVRRLWDEYQSGAQRFCQEGTALYVAHAGGRVLGVCGLTPDPHVADSTVGRLRHLYVLPPFRQHKVGSRLTTAVIAEARSHYQVLTLRSDNPDAAAFYRALGFSTDPPYPSATHYLRLTGE